ncbi:MAG: DUF58 domain-containing protein [Thermoleophilia bacterium]|nr:DUF58 domain-containing protein [Thermoleophilia bacterium]
MAQYALTFPLVPRRRLVGLAFGAMRSVRRGRGFDVAGSRPYRPGDDMRAIDWGASARLSAARGADEFLVRERFAEEAPRVVIVCDRRPEMALFPPGFPWLSKPAAMREIGTLIADSALKARGLVGYLDYACVEHPDPALRTEAPFWRPPASQHEHWRLKESHLLFPYFHAPRDNLTRAFRYLTELKRHLPAGSFVFVLSDFIEMPAIEVWTETLELPWDIVPVVVQDRIWEQSFPSVAGVVLPLADPATGRIVSVRLTRREGESRRRAHEARLERLLDDFESLDLQPVVVSTTEPDDILRSFLAWAEERTAVLARV